MNIKPVSLMPDMMSVERVTPQDTASASCLLQTNGPLVSVVVTNFNYAAYLEQAVESVMRQSYRHIECVIVDDCSTDNSFDVIEQLKSTYSDLKIIRNSINSGQYASCVAGFRATSGAYVIFLDADDYLLPECIEMHVRVNLSLRLAVGFTSVDMYRLVDGRITTTTSEDMAGFIRHSPGPTPRICRNFEPDEGGAEKSSLPKKLYYVHPKCSGQWPWSPSSANCFRRDALDLILNNERLCESRVHADTYILRGVSALCGSVLIDLPLAAYRIHGNNNFIYRAPLHRMRFFHIKAYKKRSQRVMRALIDHIIDNLEELSLQVEDPYYLVEALTGLSDTFPKVEASRYGLNYLTEVALKRHHWISRILGPRRFHQILFCQEGSRRRFWLVRLLSSLRIKLAIIFLPFALWAVDHGLLFPEGKSRRTAVSGTAD